MIEYLKGLFSNRLAEENRALKAEMESYRPIFQANAMVINNDRWQCQFCDEFDYKHKTTCRAHGFKVTKQEA